MCLEDPMAVKECRERSPLSLFPELDIENGILKMEYWKCWMLNGISFYLCYPHFFQPGRICAIFIFIQCLDNPRAEDLEAREMCQGIDYSLANDI